MNNQSWYKFLSEINNLQMFSLCKDLRICFPRCKNAISFMLPFREKDMWGHLSSLTFILLVVDRFFAVGMTKQLISYSLHFSLNGGRGRSYS